MLFYLVKDNGWKVAGSILMMEVGEELCYVMGKMKEKADMRRP